MVKNLPGSAGDIGNSVLIPRWGDPFGLHGNPLPYSCLENPMERGAWQGILLGPPELDTTEVT